MADPALRSPSASQGSKGAGRAHKASPSGSSHLAFSCSEEMLRAPFQATFALALCRLDIMCKGLEYKQPVSLGVQHLLVYSSSAR